MLTDLAIAVDQPQTDHCGTCRACLDACPTQALVEPGVLDARRCISYLNIEHRGDFEAPFSAAIAPWLHGCDVCQEVCPFVAGARRRGRRGDAAFAVDTRWQNVNLQDLVKLSEADWDSLTRGSDVRRGGPERLRRIAARLLAEEAKTCD